MDAARSSRVNPSIFKAYDVRALNPADLAA